jgi:hypothetical protein
VDAPPASAPRVEASVPTAPPRQRELVDGGDLSQDPWARVPSPPSRKRVSTNSGTVPESTPFVHAASAISCTCERCRGRLSPGSRATEWRASVFARLTLVFGGEVGVPLSTRDIFLAVPLLAQEAKSIDWREAVRLDPTSFAPRAPQGFHLFDPVPDGVFKSSGLGILRQGAQDEARSRFGLGFHEDAGRGVYQQEGESRDAFLSRVQEKVREDGRQGAEASRDKVRKRLRDELDLIEKELGIPLGRDLSHAVVTLLLGADSPLHFAERMGASAQAAESWGPRHDSQDRLDRLHRILEKAKELLPSRPAGAKLGALAVLPPREVRVDSLGLAWTRA